MFGGCLHTANNNIVWYLSMKIQQSTRYIFLFSLLRFVLWKIHTFHSCFSLKHMLGSCSAGERIFPKGFQPIRTLFDGDWMELFIGSVFVCFFHLIFILIFFCVVVFVWYIRKAAQIRFSFSKSLCTPEWKEQEGKNFFFFRFWYKLKKELLLLAYRLFIYFIYILLLNNFCIKSEKQNFLNFNGPNRDGVTDTILFHTFWTCGIVVYHIEHVLFCLNLP